MPLCTERRAVWMKIQIHERWWCRASCPRMSVDILGTNCDQCLSTVQCCFTSTETVRLTRTGSPGRPPRLSHSSWTLLQCRSLFIRTTTTATVAQPRYQKVETRTTLIALRHSETITKEGTLVCAATFFPILLLPWCVTSTETLRLIKDARRRGKRDIYMWASALCTRFYNNPAPVIRSTQFHYCTVSNPGTGADDACVLKRGV